MFIPLQHGTTDTCRVAESHSSDDLLRICLQRGWQQLGWIHTHPTFDAYLSSIDQHTQYYHQNSAPYCVAAVVGKDGNTEFFQLTHAGMEFLPTCTSSGFHEHPAGMVTAISVVIDSEQPCTSMLEDNQVGGQHLITVSDTEEPKDTSRPTTRASWRFMPGCQCADPTHPKAGITQIVALGH